MIFALQEENGLRAVEVQRDGAAYRILDAGEEPLAVDARPLRDGQWSLLIGPSSYEARVRRQGSTYSVEIGGRVFAFDLTDPDRAALRSSGAGAHGPGRITAPMPGRVVRLLAQVGDRVQRGDGVVVVEAMKMENELAAPRDGIITELAVSEGQPVEGGVLLAVIGDVPAVD